MFVIAQPGTYLKPRPVSITALLLVICAGLIVYAGSARDNRNAYSLAEDLPRGPLVYAQFQNLPALMKQWDQSPLKQQYLASANYQQFQHGHLALKIISRWEEFNNALGFPLDMPTLSGATEGGAAVAIYDIGQLDLVFIAPLSDEKIALTNFFKGKDQFTETEAPDGTPYYQHAVEADRGRQKQVLAFAAIKGRFILASNEKLLLRAIANINRHATRDSLSDDPAFQALSQKLSPHFATVWVDQTKLNDDYYFKHYWLMQNASQLKGIRAGLFDLEREEGKWIERREFLTTGKDDRRSGGSSAAETRRLYSLTPGDAPFVRVQSLTGDPALTGTIARDTLFDNPVRETASRGRTPSWQSYDTDDFSLIGSDDESESDKRYSYLNSSYDTTIDDPQDARISARAEPGGDPLATGSEQQFLTSLQAAIAPARPSAAAIATCPHTVDGPLFLEFRKVAILNLQSPGNLRRDLLESAIAQAVLARLTVAGPTAELKWESRSDAGHSWRELHLPMLGWEICYALGERELILANSASLLKTVLDAPRQQHPMEISSAIEDLTIIRLDQRKQAFDDIGNILDADLSESRRLAGNEPKASGKPSTAFFSGNISSLLDVAGAVSYIVIKRSASSNQLHEEIEFILK